jgi:mannose/cellobiose epimerase-like protein (N-acyl-D-glucosamine 2-epimerase family)
VPAVLAGDYWKQHWVNDLAPYWTMPEALGTPAGNYPTYRTMRGLPGSNTDRYPRMLGRQIYVYCMGYALTGDETLLERARVGVEWLRTKAKDPRGGYFSRLDAAGNGVGTEPKWSQDLSYVMLGYAAWWFVTRDPVAEAELLAGRDLLFDPATYWDAANHRIRDGVTPDLSAEADMSNDNGGWELVAQLDPVNAFLGLTQPTLSSPARRAQVLDDLRTLGQTMLTNFRDEETGIFWGSTTQKHYAGWHVDWGHTLKTYWMLLQIDKKLPDHPFQHVVLTGAPPLLDRAFDAPWGRWGKAPTSPTEAQFGTDWWIAAELDQLTATMNLFDRAHEDRLAATAGHWKSDWVDYRVGEVVSSLRRDGSWAYSWPDGDTGKCNEWKNGFHSTEHALVLYLAGRDLEGLPAELHFAVPASDTDTFIATPYVFSGEVLRRDVLGDVTVGTRTLKKVKVSFQHLY